LKQEWKIVAALLIAKAVAVWAKKPVSTPAKIIDTIPNVLFPLNTGNQR